MAKLYINDEMVHECQSKHGARGDIHSHIRFIRKVYLGNLRRSWFRNKDLDLKHLVEFDSGINCFINAIPKHASDGLKPHRIAISVNGERYIIQMHDECLGVKFTNYNL